MKNILTKLKKNINLSFEESKKAFEILMDGKASDLEIFDFLTFLTKKGEVSDEIAGGVYVLRNKALRVNVSDCIDTCGTGGDGLEALNIKIDLEPREIEQEISNNNFGFMFAPNFHSAMKYVGPVRKKIGKRTIFNMISPLR